MFTKNLNVGLVGSEGEMIVGGCLPFVQENLHILEGNQGTVDRPREQQTCQGSVRKHFVLSKEIQTDSTNIV